MTQVLEAVASARERVLDIVLEEGHSVCVVDSPPGAGKTRLIEDLVFSSVEEGLRVGVLTPRLEQSFDLVRRLLANFSRLPLQIFQSTARDLPDDLARNPQVPRPVSDPRQLQIGPGVVVGTASKFNIEIHRFPRGHDEFDLLVCDESYQLPYKDLEDFPAIAKQLLLVGDPGQLPPVISVDTRRFEAARFKVHWPAPKEFLRRYPTIPVVQLPATYRFTDDSVGILQPAFYPTLSFSSAVNVRERQLSFGAAGLRNPIDRVLDMIVSGTSIVVLALPKKVFITDEVDVELAQTMAQVCARALERRARWEGNRTLTTADVACADPHVASGAAIRDALQRSGKQTDAVLVDTPEILQGLQRPFMVVKHSMSGVQTVDEFALQPGRMCVMLSRHQLGCVIVTRDGVAQALESYEHDSGARPTGGEDIIWNGYRAHSRLWDELESNGRVVRI